ncbi:hypothetical protein [Algoriphagus sp. PAP.12]|uniref:hypothetical protein n=1 Tax=Algoriphagus sp. PAP.12 TaxID=2996678 RepID=UPI00227C8F22|nr:hypothetical protein [Algoriphagus sp. PAP.12]
MRYIYILFLLMVVSSCQIFESASKDYTLEELEILYGEIQELSESKSCTNSSEWKFVALGSKPCGGPWKYIAYSSSIDEAKFLEKVKTYNKLQAEDNAKNERFSDCMYVSPPSSVVCEAGKPVFQYD